MFVVIAIIYAAYSAGDLHPNKKMDVWVILLGAAMIWFLVCGKNKSNKK
jgi:hypothetical protein